LRSRFRRVPTRVREKPRVAKERGMGMPLPRVWTSTAEALCQAMRELPERQAEKRPSRVPVHRPSARSQVCDLNRCPCPRTCALGPEIPIATWRHDDVAARPFIRTTGRLDSIEAYALDCSHAACAVSSALHIGHDSRRSGPADRRRGLVGPAAARSVAPASSRTRRRASDRVTRWRRAIFLSHRS
jgi:hypothetical protein